MAPVGSDRRPLTESTNPRSTVSMMARDNVSITRCQRKDCLEKLFESDLDFLSV